MVSECEWVSMIYWLHQAGSRKWFVIAHLHRVSDPVSEKTNTQWAYPSSEDIQIAEKEQVLHCKVEGERNLNNLQNIKYVSRNSDQIIAVFSEQ